MVAQFFGQASGVRVGSRPSLGCPLVQSKGSRPFRNGCSTCSALRLQPQHQRTWVIVQARDRSGPSGLNVGGHSPTSPSGWDAMRQSLQDAGVKMVSPQEVVFAAERDNVIIVDVRPEADYEKGHIPDAYNVPFYRPIIGWEPFKIARRVGYAMFGVLNGTEVNPDFAREVCELLEGSDKAVVLYCSQGGVLESTETHKRGWQTRSLVAAYDLTQDGVKDVQVLKEGFTGWTNSGRDIEVLEYADEGAEEVAT